MSSKFCPKKDSVQFSRKSTVWFLPLLELSMRCKRPPHKQTVGRFEENESHPGGILPRGHLTQGHLPKGLLPRGHTGDLPLEGSGCRPKGQTGIDDHMEGESVCKGPMGGDTECKEQRGGSPQRRARLHGPCGLRVVGHSEEFCLCSASRGSPGSAVGRGEAGLDLHPGFYENES